MKLASIDPKNKIFSHLSMLVFFAIGMLYFPMRIIGWDFTHIPGDLGDARFNMFILEHGYQYLIGKTELYWNANFLYPAKNVIAYSDNLLGTMPFYAFFRWMGSDLHTSFQYWVIVLFGLNFGSAYFTFSRLFKNPIIAGICAYIFAFGLYNLGQIYHAQLFPRFAIPLIFYCHILFLKKGKIALLVWTIVLLVYQFYCGIYLGFFAVYGLIFISILYPLFFWRKINPRVFFKFRKKDLMFFAIIILSIIGLYYLFVPYLLVSKEFGMRDFEIVKESLPQLRSYFFSAPASVMWNEILYSHSANKFEQWWLQFLLPGLMPYLIILCSLPLLIVRKGYIGLKRYYFFGLLMLITVLFTIRIGDFTFYKLFFSLPGFSSMRAINRVINVNVIFILFFAAEILYQYLKEYSRFYFILLTIPVLVFVDNSYYLNWEVKRYEKSTSQTELKYIQERLSSEYKPAFKAVAFQLPEGELTHEQVINHHISTMLACQALGYTSVNGYTGNYPNNYMPFFDHVSKKSLNLWLESNQRSRSEVQLISYNP